MKFKVHSPNSFSTNNKTNSRTSRNHRKSTVHEQFNFIADFEVMITLNEEVPKSFLEALEEQRVKTEEEKLQSLQDKNLRGLEELPEGKYSISNVVAKQDS